MAVVKGWEISAIFEATDEEAEKIADRISRISCGSGWWRHKLQFLPFIHCKRFSIVTTKPKEIT